MTRKTLWVLLSLLMALSLVLAACAPAPAPAPTPTPAPKPTPTPTPTPAPKPAPAKEKEMVRDTLGKMVEKPGYGGTLILCLSEPIVGLDPGITVPWVTYTAHNTYDDLLQGDWAKGPAGTGEISWQLPNFPPKLEWVAGCLAESWELTDPNTLVFHLRKGVRFHDKPPVSGREFTSADVLYTWERLMGLKGYYYEVNFKPGKGMEKLTAPDKYTIVAKCTPGKTGDILENFGDKTHIVPREMVEKWGDLRDWRAACGTGPFILTDYVAASSASFQRNPNYWMKDPLHPNNQLPYLDSLKILIVEDASTRLAALRTGKIDILSGISWEDAKSLRQTTPMLLSSRTLATTYAIGMRADIKPFEDIRVRRALNMALDRRAMTEHLWGGEVEFLSIHVANLPDFADMYTPLDKLPESTREIFEYNADKAKKLLAEAGYPNGFKTEVVCISGQIDTLSVIKDYLAKIGVDMALDVKEYAVWTGIMNRNTHKQMFFQNCNPTNPFRFSELRWGTGMTTYVIKDPVIEELFIQNYAEYFNPAKRMEIVKKANLHALSQAYYIYLPTPYVYRMWWPWLKNYHGEHSVGFQDVWRWPKFIWIDQELKAEMAGRK